MAFTRKPHMGPVPEARATVPVEISCSAEQFEVLRRGKYRDDMDDPFDVAFEDPWLHFFSHHGDCCFGLRFAPNGDRFRAVEAWMTRDPMIVSGDWFCTAGGHSVEGNACYLIVVLWQWLHPGERPPADIRERLHYASQRCRDERRRRQPA